MIPSAADAVPSVAVLLAGQVRSLIEPKVSHDIRSVLRHMRPMVFAHLSLEHSYAPWHSLQPDTSGNASNVQYISSMIRRTFRPAYLRIMPDSQVVKDPRWVGRAQGQAGEQSVLFFRWILLLEAMSSVETERGSRFGFVLRQRPDSVLLCEPAASPARWMDGFHAVQDGDQVVLMTRDAASVALSAYLHASQSAPCRLKVELCVAALLLSQGFSVGTMQPGAAVVRPEAFCTHVNGKAMLQDNDKLSCGRSFLGSRKPPCSTPPTYWNLTSKVAYWSSTERTKRRAARNSEASNRNAGHV